MKTPIAQSSVQSKPRGRPRAFDLDEAIDLAIPVLCERGFHGTSIDELAAAMHLTMGSIYKAFKDKRGVFLAALERESSLRDMRLRAALASYASGRDKIQAALLFYVGLSHGEVGVRGCLTISTAVELSTSDPEIANRAGDVFKRRETHLTELIKQGQADGSISPDYAPEGTARLLLCVLQGMRVVGKTGRSEQELLSVVEAAMRTLN